jgi:hypothetical protein
MKDYCIPALIACALLTVLVIRQKAAAQNGSSKPTDVSMSTVAVAPTAATKQKENSPPFITQIPRGYRDWKLISVAREKGNLDDIRAVLGNDVAIKACQEGTRPFPEGTIIVRIAWSFVPSQENNKAFGTNQSFVAGSPKNGVQFMMKDSKKYAATGGWGYGQFDDGKVANASKLRPCFDCHKSYEDHDFVFSHYAP